MRLRTRTDHPHSLYTPRGSCDISWLFPESLLKFFSKIVPALRVVQRGPQACIEVREVGEHRDSFLGGHWRNARGGLVSDPRSSVRSIAAPCARGHLITPPFHGPPFEVCVRSKPASNIEIGPSSRTLNGRTGKCADVAKTSRQP